MPFLTDRYHDQNEGDQAIEEPRTLNRTGTFDAVATTASVGQRLLGQAPALQTIERVLMVAQAGLHDHERPLASLLLVGPTGVGKTELVRRLAAEIRNGPDDFCRIDMGQLAQEHYAASLAGAPPGYAGSRENMTLFDKSLIEGTPLMPGIVLFDEVEKAHPQVLRALLGALDYGKLTLASGLQKISFRNTFVFMTSNLGSAEVARQRRRQWRRVLDTIAQRPALAVGSSWAEKLWGIREASLIDGAIEEFFEPEFLNRLDAVIKFNEISHDTAREIVRLRLSEVLERFRRRDVELVIGDGVDVALVNLGFDPVYGARSLGRTVREHVVGRVARALVEHRQMHPDDQVPLELRLDRAFGPERIVLTVTRGAATKRADRDPATDPVDEAEQSWEQRRSG